MGLLDSILGTGKQTTTETKSAFEGLPKEVKDAYIKTYLPSVLQQFSAPRQDIPMVRAQAPQSIFDSQELWRYQQFKDSQAAKKLVPLMGNPGGGQQNTTTTTNNTPMSQDAFTALLKAINPNYGIPNDTTTLPIAQMQQKTALEQAYKRFIGGGAV